MLFLLYLSNPAKSDSLPMRGLWEVYGNIEKRNEDLIRARARISNFKEWLYYITYITLTVSLLHVSFKNSLKKAQTLKK